MNFTPHKPCDFIKAQTLAFTKAFSSGQKGTTINTSLKKEILICWKSPSNGWVKLNVDGAVGPVGGGGLLRDCRGKWIEGFSANLRWCSSVKAELLALQKGLRLAWHTGARKLEVEMDSQVAINLIQEPYKANQAHCFSALFLWVVKTV